MHIVFLGRGADAGIGGGPECWMWVEVGGGGCEGGAGREGTGGERRNENENELGLFFLLAFWTPWDILEWTYRTGSRRPYLTTPER